MQGVHAIVKKKIFNYYLYCFEVIYLFSGPLFHCSILFDTDTRNLQRTVDNIRIYHLSRPSDQPLSTCILLVLSTALYSMQAQQQTKKLHIVLS